MPIEHVAGPGVAASAGWVLVSSSLVVVGVSAGGIRLCMQLVMVVHFLRDVWCV